MEYLRLFFVAGLLAVTAHSIETKGNLWSEDREWDARWEFTKPPAEVILQATEYLEYWEYRHCREWRSFLDQKTGLWIKRN